MIVYFFLFESIKTLKSHPTGKDGKSTIRIAMADDGNPNLRHPG